VLIARTDARAVNGLDDALDRARRAHEAGADLLFVEALQHEAEIERTASELAGVPLLFNWVEGGRTPPLPLSRIAELGFALVILPVSTLLAATSAMQEVLAAIRRDGTTTTVADRLTGFADFTDLVGLPEITELEARFGS
jgi:2,3-dimethylmalate lyase